MMPFKTILFATDFSPASSVAFEVASALARDYRARVIALHVIEPVHIGFSEYAAYAGEEEDRREATTKLQAIKAPSARISMEYHLLEGDPAMAIAKAAADMGADLIVMGTHGRTGLTRLVMGSVAEEVLRSAPCPVLTVRDSARVEIPKSEVEEVPEVLSI